MADIAKGLTCVDTENTLVPAASPTLAPGVALTTHSLHGTFGAPVPCTATPRGPHDARDGTPLYDEEVCVGGGTFVFGSYPGLTPQRIVTVAPFLMDKYEVSVARFRDAVRRGMPWACSPLANDRPYPAKATDSNLAQETNIPLCSYSHAPMGRETLPLNCIAWPDAKAFCEFEGGHLPSEVQMEWVMAAAGRVYKTIYPWGGPALDSVPCSRGDFGRGWIDLDSLGPCASFGFGPAPVAQSDKRGGDVSVGFGIVDLAYNVEEWMADSYDPLDSRCWMEQPIAATTCIDPGTPQKAIRGGSWTSRGDSGAYTIRYTAPTDDFSTELGLRCVREVTR
jgi:formylglycine-generating enzyme required for sulfatase activity